MLKIQAKDLPTLPLGDSRQLQVGDLIFAIGDPFGIGETATMGIVGATGRGGWALKDTKTSFRPMRRSIREIPAER